MSQLADVNTQSSIGMFYFMMTYVSCCIQGGPKKTVPACFIANVLNTPRPNLVEI